MNVVKCLMVAMAAVTLASCANSPAYVGGRTWDAGWRKAVVSGINDELRWYQSASCGIQPAAGDKFVVVKYQYGHHPYWKYIPMAAKAVPPLHSKVLLNVKSCEVVPNA